MSNQSHKSSSWWDLVPSTVDLGDLAHSTAEAAADTLREAVGTAADAGNAAVQEALALGEDVVGAGQQAAEQARSTGSDLFDAIAAALVGDGQAEHDEVERSIELPDQDSHADPAEDIAEEVIDSGGQSTYKDQRDNESAHVGGDYSCSPTSFAMALIDSIGDEAAVRQQTVALIEERGGNTDYQQTEELIIELLQVIDWSAVCAASPSFFWNGKDWAAWAKSTYGGKYYKDPYAQQYAASLYKGMSSEGGTIYGGIFGAEEWAPVIDAMDAGATVTAEGGAMTGSGHVIRILDADETGLLVNDPYGLWLGKSNYFKNGAETLPMLGGDQSIFDRRASQNPELAAQYDAYAEEGPDWTPYGRWGEQNWFSWADADSAQIGKWVSVFETS